MQQIKQKKNLSKAEVQKICKEYNLGKLKKFSMFKIGNINSNYFVKTDKGKFVIRYYQYKKIKDIKLENDFLNYLASNKFKSPIPIKKPIGRINCFKYIEGKEPKTNDIQTIKKIAKKLAKLHNLSEKYKGKKNLETETKEDLIKELKKHKKDILKSKFRNPSIFIKEVLDGLENIKLDKRMKKILIHADLKKDNILIKNGEISGVLDFDNMYKDYLIVDIGATAIWWCFEGTKLNKVKLKEFIKSYETTRKLTKLEKKHVLETIKLNLLRHAVRFAVILLHDVKRAEHGWYFLNSYKNI